MQAAVLGKPIVHSKSPLLHMAAYRTLGLDWCYSKYEVAENGLAQFLGNLSEDFVGLSLTMPLKKAILKFGVHLSDLVRRTGVANTVYWNDNGQLCLDNTDVAGIVAALKNIDYFFSKKFTVTILGGGATASSAIVALAILGIFEAKIFLRNKHQMFLLANLAKSFGVNVSFVFFGVEKRIVSDLIISTLPVDAANFVAENYLFPNFGNKVFLDVIYEPWPTSLAAVLQNSGSFMVSGAEILLYQALEQVKIFTAKYYDWDLCNDSYRVLHSMRKELFCESFI